MEKDKNKRRLKGWVYNTLFVIAGAVIGEIIAVLAKNVKVLSWLSHNVPIGITEPVRIDLIVAQLDFGFYFKLCPALVICIVLALALGNFFLSGKPKPKKADTATDDGDGEDDQVDIRNGEWD